MNPSASHSTELQHYRHRSAPGALDSYSFDATLEPCRPSTRPFVDLLRGVADVGVSDSLGHLTLDSQSNVPAVRRGWFSVRVDDGHSLVPLKAARYP